MQADHETITKTLFLYSKYLKVMDIDINDRPIITFTKQEYIQAIGTERMPYIRQKSISDKNLETCFGQCMQKFRNYNSVIFMNMGKFQKFYGLHERVQTDKITKTKYVWIMYKGKKVRAYQYVTYQRFKKIGHLEETLVHELLHHKKPELRHGKKFNKLVQNYINKRDKAI